MMMKMFSVFVCLMLKCSAKKMQCDVVKDFGAMGNNASDDTQPIQDAIDECHEVLVPSGKTFRVTNSLALTSNLTIVIEENASIFSDQSICDPHVKDSCVQNPRCPTLYWSSGPTAILCGTNLTNIAIIGQDVRTSIIDGGGWKWCVVFEYLLMEYHSRNSHTRTPAQVRSWSTKYLDVGYGSENVRVDLEREHYVV